MYFIVASTIRTGSLAWIGISNAHDAGSLIIVKRKASITLLNDLVTQSLRHCERDFPTMSDIERALPEQALARLQAALPSLSLLHACAGSPSTRQSLIAPIIF